MSDFPIQAIEAIFVPWDKSDSPGCCVGIIRDDELVYSRGFGRASLEYDIPIDGSTVFDVASMCKQFTAYCIALEVEAGRLQLDDDIRQFLPSLPPTARTVTIRHLLHHSSGLPDYFSLLDEKGFRSADYVDRYEVLSLLEQQSVMNFQPGERFEYSNTGYFLLGEIIERVSGRTLAAYAQAHIFDKLGMTGTWFQDDHTRIVPRRATGYSLNDDGHYYTDVSTQDIVGDGALLTCVEDLLLWDRNFYANQLGQGNQSLIEMMLVPGRLNDGTVVDYGFGLSLTPYRGLSSVSHGGWFVGYRSGIMRFPLQQLTIICLANTSVLDAYQSCFQVVDQLLQDHFSPGTGPIAGDSSEFTEQTTDSPTDLAA